MQPYICNWLHNVDGSRFLAKPPVGWANERLNPEQRRAVVGDQRLKISGADFGVGGTDFYEKEWENIHFYDCIFYGVIHLTSIRNCVFEHCQFPGSNFQAYDFENVVFLRSDTLGEANLMAGKAIDFTGVQVQRLDAKGLVRFAGQKIVTTDSNVHLP